MHRTELLKSFATAALLLPEPLSRAAYTLSDEEKLLCEGFRIRLGRPLTAHVGLSERPLALDGRPVLVTPDAMEALVARVTESSVHSYSGQMAGGFITAEQGHRLGLCGEMVHQGDTAMVRNLSSINLRIAKQVRGIADALCGVLYRDGFTGTLIVAPPGAGKTTLLRDMSRWLSHRMSVAVVDERYELAACRRGVPRFDVGACDILSGSPKAPGIELLLRSMAPRVIALDEITAVRDVEALMEADACGCGFVTTAHGAEVSDLGRRPVYRALMETGIFQNIIQIEHGPQGRRYRAWREGGVHGGQAGGAHSHRGVVLGGRTFYEQEPQNPGEIAAQLCDSAADY